MRTVRSAVLGCVLVALATLATVATLLVPREALAAEDPEAFARVVVDTAEMRTGPGVSYRVVYTAQRGETLAIDGRQGAGFWLRILLPDGRVAYALGDEVQVFAVRPGEAEAPSRPGLFASPPLAGAHAGLAIVGGVLSIPIASGETKAFGYLEARPSIVVHPTVTLDGFIGDALTADGAQILYGGGAAINFAPTWPICPFLGIGGGGLAIRPNADSFVLKRQDLYVARAGGGILMALRGRILVRLEVTNLTLFDSDTFKNAQTYSGGFGVYFLKGAIMHTRTSVLVVSLLSLVFVASCVTVKPQQRAVLADPIMQFDGDPQSAAQLRHAIDNREGSYGGGGVSGGGCGCN